MTFVGLCVTGPSPLHLTQLHKHSKIVNKIHTTTSTVFCSELKLYYRGKRKHLNDVIFQALEQFSVEYGK